MYISIRCKLLEGVYFHKVEATLQSWWPHDSSRVLHQNVGCFCGSLHAMRKIGRLLKDTLNLNLTSGLLGRNLLHLRVVDDEDWSWRRDRKRLQLKWCLQWSTSFWASSTITLDLGFGNLFRVRCCLRRYVLGQPIVLPSVPAWSTRPKNFVEQLDSPI